MDPSQLPLRDLHLPAEIGWWPLAPGWWILIALAAGGFAWLLYRAWRRFLHNRPRRAALRKLSGVRGAFEYGADPVALATEISEILRRAMLAYAPRADVAGLTGPRWLRWLDRGLEQPLFSQGPGQLVESLPYRAPGQVGDDDVDLRGLLDAAATRLKTPLPGGSR